MQLSIIIPAHNEEARLGRMLDAYLPYFDKIYGREYELLVVVNGCNDRTEEVVKRYAQAHPQLKSIIEPHSVGKGGAVMLGFAQACGDNVGFVDADGATPPAAFQDLADGIGDADAIIASRWCKGAVISPRQPLLRRVASRIFNCLVRLFFSLRLSDTQCGAKLIKRDAVQRVLPCLGITRWAFDVDLLFQLRRAGFRIVEIPTTWHDVSGSRLNVPRASVEMFVALVRLRLVYSPLKCVVALYDRTFGRVIPLKP